MNKIYIYFIGWLLVLKLGAQPIIKNDSIQKNNNLFEVINVEEIDVEDDNSVDIAVPLLSSSRNSINQFAQFNGSVAGFKLRAFSNKYSNLQVNGIDFKNVYNESIETTLFSGIYPIFTNQIGLKNFEYNETNFGNIGFTNINEVNPATQNKSFKSSYQYGNRSFQHQINGLYHSGYKKNNWYFTILFNYRNALDGQILNGFVDTKNGAVSIQKIFLNSSNIKLNIFYTESFNSKRTAITKEFSSLTNNAYINPQWGYKNGSLFLVNNSYNKIPVFILNYTNNFNAQEFISLNISYTNAVNIQYGLDWQNANDAKPDYYKKLPSYQTDSLLQIQIANNIKNNINVQYINWDNILQVNKKNFQIHTLNNNTGEQISGNFSHYVLKANYLTKQSIQWNNYSQFIFVKKIILNVGLRFKREIFENKTILADLLGGDYYINWNYFSNSLLGSTNSQYDLKNPNKIVFVGDEYGPHFALHYTEYMGYLQTKLSIYKFNILLGGQYYFKNYVRVGLNQNGLFPNNSLGSSQTIFKNDFNTILNITKFIGKRFYMQWATNYSNHFFDIQKSFINIQLQDNLINGITNEQYLSHSILLSYKSDKLQCNVHFFLNKIENEYQNISFFHDGFNQFVRGIIYDIEKKIWGVESSIDITFNEYWKSNIVAILGNYIHSNNPHYNLFLQNDNFNKESGILYLNNLPISGTPQSAFSIGISYNYKYRFFATLKSNLYIDNYINYNYFRRSNQVLQNLEINSNTFKEILNPVLIPITQTVDFFIGSSVRFKIKNMYKNVRISLNVQNILNVQTNTLLAYEQLRFDYTNKNIHMFSPKYLTAMGINFNFSIQINL